MTTQSITKPAAEPQAAVAVIGQAAPSAPSTRARALSRADWLRARFRGVGTRERWGYGVWLFAGLIFGLFRRQKALGDGDLRGYAARLGLDVAASGRDRASTEVADRIRRDAGSGLAPGQVAGTPALFIGGVVHRGGYDSPALLAALGP